MLQEKEKANQVEELVIQRIINAPRKLVFKAFTEASSLAEWWGPKGTELEVLQLDIRPGGLFHYSFQYPNGDMMWGRFAYHEIKSPDLIVFVSSFADEKGNIIRAPFPGLIFPLEVMNRWTFVEQDGKTTITLHAAPYNATEEELNCFINMKASMNSGFNGTFDQLDQYLAKL